MLLRTKRIDRNLKSVSELNKLISHAAINVFVKYLE